MSLEENIEGTVSLNVVSIRSRQVSGINRVGSTRRPSRRNSCESQMMGDEMSLRELTQVTEEKPRVMKMGKRNIKAQVLHNLLKYLKL